MPRAASSSATDASIIVRGTLFANGDFQLVSRQFKSCRFVEWIDAYGVP